MTVDKAVAYGRSRVGDNESPAGSNRGWFWSHVHDHWGVSLAPNAWCGAFVIDCAYHGGLKLPWQMVSVHYIENWGRARGRFHYGVGGVRKGDLVILFGGRHVEMAAADGTRGGVQCIGGNTGGNEPWKGGTVAYGFRNKSQVRGYVRIYDKYPKPPKFSPVPFPLKKVPAHYFGKKLKFDPKTRPRIHNGHASSAERKSVARVQVWLTTLGYYSGACNGYASDRLHVAVVNYQKKHKYKKPNGAVGPGTWLNLQKSVYNKKYK